MKRVNLPFAVLAAALLLVAVVADPVTAVNWELDCDSGAVFTWQAMVTDSVGDPIPSGDYELIYCYYEDSAGLNLIGCCTTIATVGTGSKGSKDDKAALSGSALAVITYAQPIWEDTTKVGHFPKMTVIPEIWLELTFNGETMSPLTLVTSVPNSGTAQRVLGDIYTAPGRALIVEPPQASSGMVDLLGNDTVASVGIYRPTDDTLPMIIMEVTDTTSTLTVFDTSRNTTISITGDGAGTFEDLVWSKTGFKFPDLTIQTTAATGGGACWLCPGNYTYLADIDDSVGIGTSTPSEKLEVVGNLLITRKATIGSGHTNSNAYAFVAGINNTVSGYASTVGGGRSNTASFFGDASSMWGHSTVAGGRSNTASADYSTVGGGQGNTASLGSASLAANGGYVTVSGGRNNYAGHFYSSIGGGYDNDALSQYATVSGGSQNTAGQEDLNDSLGVGATVGGGSSNTASGRFSLVGGGESNTSKAAYGGISSGYSNLAGDGPEDTAAVVSGGYDNAATAKYAVVGGGASNTASGSWCTISGGEDHTADSNYSTIGGGRFNKAINKSATVSGGGQNHATGVSSSIGGGDSNTGSAWGCRIGGGRWHFIDTAASNSTIAGGYSNTISDSGGSSTIAGGRDNLAGGFGASIGGGLYDTTKAVYGGVFSGYSNLAGNDATDTAAYVGGGWNNEVFSKYGTICGGKNNSIAFDAFHGVICGGLDNLDTNGNYNAIGGGKSNTASGNSSTISGGASNEALGDYNSIGGGQSNTTNGSWSTITGGVGNYVNTLMGSIVGGHGHSVEGTHSIVLGGAVDTITSSGTYSMIFGSTVYINSSYRAALFNVEYPGKLGINRDDNDGGINHPIHVGTHASNGNGAYLTGGGAWTNGSSREFKENFQQLDGEDVLNRIGQLPIESWEYKGTGERHIWPCAEDFHEQFGVGVLNDDGSRDTKYLAAGDVAGVALAGVKELAKDNRELRERIVQLEALVEALLAQQDDSNEPKAEFGMNK